MSGRQLLGNRVATLPPVRDDRTGPDPTFLDSVGAAFRIGRDDQIGAEEEAIMNAYGPLITALTERGMSINDYVVPARGYGSPVNESAVWRDIDRIRQRDPRAFGGVAANRDAFRTDAMRRYKARIEDDTTTVQRGGTVPMLVGGIGAAMTDPINLGLSVVTGGLGAGRTVATTILREAVVNAGIEAAQQPLIAVQRGKTDRSLGLDEAALNVAIGGAAGAGLAGIGLGIRRGVPALTERTIAGVWDRLPEGVRQRWAGATEITEQDLPDLAELAIGRDNMSTDEAAAAGALRQDGAIERDNPFIANGAGEAMHRQRLGDAVSAILADVPPPSPALPRSPATRRAALGDTTAIGSGTIPMGRDAVKARIGRAESPSDVARNLMSSATGRYQFTRGTFIAYHRRVYGGDLSDAQRWAQATDGGVQERLMDALLADNAAFLKRTGEAESAGNLYLVHFVGQGGAKKLFAADPSTPVARVLGEDVVRANPFLRGRTVADTIAWAHQRMGGPTPARAGARAELAGGVASEVDTRARLQSEIDALQAEAIARDAAPVETRNVADLVEPVAASPRAADPVTVAPIRLQDDERVAFGAMQSVDDAMAYVGRALHAQQALGFLDKLGQVRPELRAAVIDRIDDLELKVGPRAQPAERANLRELLNDADDSTPVRLDALVDAEPIVRAPKARTLPVRRRPSDMVEFLADRGGLRDDEGHLLRQARDMGKVFVPRAGPLVRPKGMGIDEAGEYLWEAGFFRERPTETEVLDMLERAVNGGEKIYALPDQAEMAGRALTDEQALELEAAIARHLPDDFPLDPVRDRDAVMDVLSEIENSGIDARGALSRVFNERMRNAQARAFEEGDYVEYRPTEPDLTEPPGRFGDAGTDGERYAPVGGGADGSGGPAAYGPVSGAEAAELIEAQVRAFADPDGDAPRAQVESAEHDLRMTLLNGVAPFDPNLVQYRVILPDGRQIGMTMIQSARREAARFAERSDDALDTITAYTGGDLDVGGVRIVQGHPENLDRVHGSMAQGRSFEQTETDVPITSSVDPAIAERQRQEAALKAGSPMRPAVDQDSTIGLGLFDATDQTRLKFDDGSERSLGEMFDDLDGEGGDIDLLRSCLPPGKAGGDA